MIRIIVTSYNEPRATEQAIKAILKQRISQEYKIVVTDPFPEVEAFIKERFGNNPKIQFILDAGEGKSATLNGLLEEFYTENKEDILVFTDGDVYMDDAALQEIGRQFENKEVGVVCGHPVPLNARDAMFGFWAHLAFDEMNKTRIQLSKEKKFFEVSGYLFAMRNGVIKSFPTGSSEDNVIPHLFWEKGYKIKYAENAKVFVLNPQNWKDWLNQKKRNIKGHLSLGKTVGKEKERRNTFFEEAKRGLAMMKYPRDSAEYAWFIGLMVGRLCAWLAALYETRITKERYKDGWREVEIQSTKPLD